jgi:DNA-binding phage protein
MTDPLAEVARAAAANRQAKQAARDAHTDYIQACRRALAVFTGAEVASAAGVRRENMYQQIKRRTKE